MSRLAIVGPVHPLRGGIAEHTAGVAEAASLRGHVVDVFSYSRQYPSLLFPGRSQFDPGPASASCDYRVHSVLDSLWPPSWRRVGDRLRAIGAEAVLLQRWHPFFAPALATVARRVRDRARIVWMVHNARPHEDLAFWRPLLTLGMQPEDLCLVHADSQGVALAGLGVASTIRQIPMPARTGVERHDPEQARARLGFSGEEVVFLFFGHVRAYKGVEVLLEALALLDVSGPAWKAVVAGEWYVDRSPAEAIVARAGLQEKVRIDDRFVPEGDVADYFAASTVVVLPYVSGSQSAVIPLAYAHGRPVVTTRVGGLPESVEEGETGWLVPPSDPAALAAVLEQIRRGRRALPDAIERKLGRHSFATLVDAIVRPADLP